MTSRHILFALVPLTLSGFIAGCLGADGISDAGVEPEPEPTCGPNGEPCTCESAEDDWPGSLSVELLDIFAESGCTQVRGFINVTPEMLNRSSELVGIEGALGVDIRGDYPMGTNFEEFSFLDDLRLISVLGATGVTSLSGLSAVSNLDMGLHIEDAPDIQSIGMGDLRSLGILEPGSRVVQEEALRLVNLPDFQTLGLPEDYTLEAAPLVLKTLPRFDPDEAIALIAQYSAMTDEERDPSPGQSPPTVICELDEAVGNNADRPCPEE